MDLIKTYKIDNSDGTGGNELKGIYKYVDYPFGKYLIRVKLDNNGEFDSIVEVQINKDFLNYQQKLDNTGWIQIEEDEE